jgi:uncharacterized protein YjaG (DUF416 family)
MPDNALSSFDAYARQITETSQVWSPHQRLVFVALLAERWLHAYEKFSEVESWGDPAVLSQIVSTVWDHLQGHPIMPADETRFIQQINENAPDTEDFDRLTVWRALQSCVMLRLALECCKITDNTGLVAKAALTAFEAVVGDFPSDIAEQQRAWKKVRVQDEFRKQSAAIKAIGAIVTFDDQTIARLRHDLGLAKTLDRKSRPRSPSKSKRVDDDSIDGWRVVVSKHLNRSGAHRIAFVASLAERLLPLYISYAATTGKGRPEQLREVLDSAWEAAKGRSFPSMVLQDLETKVNQGALDTEDSQAWSAWSAWRTLQLALACCGSVENSELAEEAALVAYERVAGQGARNEPNASTNQHQRPEIYNEIMKQMMLLTRLRAMVTLDEQAVESLRTQA